MAYDNLTPEVLEQRVRDFKDVEFVMGRLAYLRMLKKNCLGLETLWCSSNTPVLNINGAVYEGHEVIYNYFSTIEGPLEEKRNDILQNFYQEIIGRSHAENYGAGSMNLRLLTTPVIEVAEDRQTAKGLWYSPGQVIEIGESGPAAWWRWEKYAVDFALENEEWRIWHFTVKTDYCAPVACSWQDEGFQMVHHGQYGADIQLPEPSRLQQPCCVPPAPYDTFIY